MQSRHLILTSSLAALVLCAVPYGCSGKTQSEPGGQAHGEGSVIRDGIPFTSHGDGSGAPIAQEGSTSSGISTDGRVAVDGNPNRDGMGGDGRVVGDGSPIYVADGAPSVGAAEGWGANSDGYDPWEHADGRADGNGYSEGAQ